MLADQLLIAFAPTTDAAAARAFYEGILSLRFVSQDAYALVFEAGGASLRIAIVSELTPAPYTILGWKVGDIAASVDALRPAGVIFQRYPFLEQDERDICTFPSGDKVAWFNDPDGNLLSLTQLA